MRSEGSAGSTIQKGQCYNDAWRTSTAVDSPLRCAQGTSGWQRGTLQIQFFTIIWQDFITGLGRTALVGHWWDASRRGDSAHGAFPGQHFGGPVRRHGGGCWGRDLDRIGLEPTKKLTIQLSMPRGRHLHWCVPTRPDRIGMELRNSILGREQAKRVFHATNLTPFAVSSRIPSRWPAAA